MYPPVCSFVLASGRNFVLQFSLILVYHRPVSFQNNSSVYTTLPGKKSDPQSFVPGLHTISWVLWEQFVTFGIYSGSYALVGLYLFFTVIYCRLKNKKKKVVTIRYVYKKNSYFPILCKMGWKYSIVIVFWVEKNHNQHLPLKKSGFLLGKIGKIYSPWADAIFYMTPPLLQFVFSFQSPVAVCQKKCHQ